MVRVLTKKAFRFTKQTGEGSLSKPPAGETPEQASARVARESAIALSKASQINKHKDHYFDVAPGIVTDCPDWIKKDELFGWGVKDEDIMELMPVAVASSHKDVPAEAAQEKLVDSEETDQDEAAQEKLVDSEETDQDEAIVDLADGPKKSIPEDGNIADAELPGQTGGRVRGRRIAGIGK